MWANAGLHGSLALDDVLDAITEATPHVVCGWPAQRAAEHSGAEHRPADRSSGARPRSWTQPPPARLAAALIHWRSRRSRVWLVLPVAGDVRGVPASRDFLAAALDAGQGVYGAGIGLVPTVVRTGASSAPPTTQWHAFQVDDPAPDPLALNEAEHELARAIRETATVLNQAQVGGVRGATPEDLARVRRASDDLSFPAGFGGRAAALIAQGERLEAMLDLAVRDSEGGAIDRTGIGLRFDALRQLRHTARRGRLAGYNAGFPGRSA